MHMRARVRHRALHTWQALASLKVMSVKPWGIPPMATTLTSSFAPSLAT